MKMNNIESRFKQAGATLAISLIILLIMTLLGVTAMKTNILEEKMVNNDRQYKVAFHAAELTLREGENQINTSAAFSNALTTDTTNASSRGLYLSSTPSMIWWNDVDWDNAYQVKASSHSSSEKPLSYIIEQLPVPNSGRDSREAGRALSRKYFRVTSRAIVTGVAAKVMVQSTYKK